MFKKTLAILFCLYICFSSQAEATKVEKNTLGTNYSKLKVDNLPIGNTISLKKLVNLPLIVTNNANHSIYVEFSSSVPTKSPEGYQPLKDISWITFDITSATLTAHSKIEVDVQIKIPDDEDLFGSKLHTYLNVHKKPLGRSGFQFGLLMTSHLFFSIAPERNDEALAKALESTTDANFIIQPDRVELFDIKAGQKVDVVNENNEKIVLKNESSKKQTYLLNLVDPKTTLVKPELDSQPRYDVDNVKIKPEEITLNPGKQRDIKIKINVPDTVDFKKGKLLYMLSITSGVPKGAIQQYLRIYLNPKDKTNPEKSKMFLEKK
ncbi:Fn3-like domain-containing protein [bacterium]|nr:Fn3-like domain-containing protein [bacterium]